MSKLAMAVAIAVLAGVAGYGIGGRSGLTPIEVAAAPEAVEAIPAATAPGLTVPPEAVQPAGQGAQAPVTPAQRLDDLSQSVGTVCETPSGECLVGQAPINSYCQCGDAAGRIVR